MNKARTVGISTQDHKLASLLFDYIVPMHSRSMVPSAVNFEHHTSIKIPSFSKQDASEVLEELLKEYIENLSAGIKRAHNLPKDTETLARLMIYQIDNIFTQRTHEVLSKNNVRSVPIFNSVDAYNQYLPEGNSKAIEITLYNANIIDTSHLEWDHVLDIRSDKKFTQQLRNFRLFLIDNYQGKDKGYILDSLYKKIEEYEASCKRHGIQLVLSSISQTLDSKSFLGAIGIATAGILTGNPVIASLGVISGAAIEVGRVIVSVLEKKLEYDKNKSDVELSYLIQLEKKTKKP